MNTLINPVKVEFDKAGYQDLVNKIIAMEKDKQKLHNVLTSLVFSFDVSREALDVLQSTLCDIVIIKDDSKDQKAILQARPKQEL